MRAARRHSTARAIVSEQYSLTPRLQYNQRVGDALMLVQKQVTFRQTEPTALRGQFVHPFHVAYWLRSCRQCRHQLPLTTIAGVTAHVCPWSQRH